MRKHSDNTNNIKSTRRRQRARPTPLAKTLQLKLQADSATSRMQTSTTKQRWPSIHPSNQPRRQSIRPEQTATNTTTAAKHPPGQNGGKAFAIEENPTTKRDPDDADEMKQRQAQKQKLSEESRWPPPAKLPRQRL